MFFCTFYENACFLRKCTFFSKKCFICGRFAAFFQPTEKVESYFTKSLNQTEKKNSGFHQKITEDRGQRCETRTCQIHVITKFLSLAQDYFSLRGHADKPLSWKPADKVGQTLFPQKAFM